MTLEDAIFQRKKIDTEKLIAYGFVKQEDGYAYSQECLQGMFHADIRISFHGVVQGTLYDNATQEEYPNIRIQSQNGDFVNKVREAYRDVLRAIVDQCCNDVCFISAQANRIAHWIQKSYDVLPDFPWEKDPGSGVFHNSINRKWFGLIMNVKRNRIDQGNGEVEILNVKADEQTLKTLLQQTGFYPAYHMNKSHWITMLLDDTLPDDTITKRIKESYRFTKK